jgi:c-di-GMP phosphodiesterase
MANPAPIADVLLPGSPGADSENSCSVRTVARQAILDGNGRVHGYELMFREGVDGSFGDDDGLESGAAPSVFETDRYSNGLQVFVRCSAETLVARQVRSLPPSRAVLLVPADAEPSPELLAACLDLKASGFGIALEWSEAISAAHPLFCLATFICVDFSQISIVALPRIARLLGPTSIAKMARNLDTQEEFEQAKLAGFTLFSGDYLLRPAAGKTRAVPANRFLNFELLRLLNHGQFDLKKIGELVQRDPALTLRLLRLVNSPFCAVRQEVRSIESALMLVGEEVFRRVATLAILGELNTGRPAEILHMALLRARFCGVASELCGLESAEQYLLGLLSLLPAMLGLPMEALTPSLPLRPEIRDALEGALGPDRTLLAWLEFHEHGNWSASDAVANSSHLHANQLMRCYADAADWARTTVLSAG